MAESCCCLALRRNSSSGTGTVSLQNQPARKISQNRSIYNDVCNVCFLHVPLTCFTTVSRRGTNATRLQLLAKWLFSIPLLSPNLEDNSHLAGWSSESKYVSCFPNMEVSKISMISPNLSMKNHELIWNDVSDLPQGDTSEAPCVVTRSAPSLCKQQLHSPNTRRQQTCCTFAFGHVGKAGHDDDISKSPLPC